MTYERLILDATVVDNFTDTLSRLSAELELIDQQADDVFDDLHADVGGDIDLGVDAGDGIADEDDGRLMTSGGFEDPALNVNEELRDLFGEQVPDIDDSFGDSFIGEDTFPMDDREMRRAIGQFRNLTLTMRPFFNLLASLLPLLGTLVGALPAVIAGLGALGAAAIAAAGALTAVGGLAILGMSLQNGEISTRPLERRITQLFQTFVDAFEPVATQLAPLATEAFDAAERMFRDLGQRADVLLSLTDDVSAGIAFLEDAVPNVLEDMVRFGERAMPMLSFMLGVLDDIDFIEVFAEVIVETIPMVMNLLSVIGRTLPAIYRISRGFLAASVAAITLLGGIVQLLGAVPFLGEAFGMLVGATLVLVSASALYTLATSRAVIATLQFAAGLFRALIPQLYNAIQAKLAYIGVQNTAIVTTVILTTVTATLVGILTFGLAPALGVASSGFSFLGSDISKATSELKRFNSVAGRTSGMSVGSSFASGSAGGQSVGYQDPSSITVVAPDQATGTSLANTFAFTNRSDVDSNVNGRIHSP